MMMLLALVPFTLLTAMQLLALVAVSIGLHARAVPLSSAWPAVISYVLGALLCCAALGLALLPAAHELRHGAGLGLAGGQSTALVLALGVVAGALVMLGPLLWGHAAGEFTLSHHLVRALLVAPTVVLYCWYVSAHR